jgi:hypothetical protein
MFTLSGAEVHTSSNVRTGLQDDKDRYDDDYKQQGVATPC